MSAKYWIKLYHEILHDAKVAKLPDNLWRRMIEVFLIAGDYDNKGELPPLDEMSWLLRLEEGILENELKSLEKINIVEKIDGVWWVRKFEERQATMKPSEYMSRARKASQGEYRKFMKTE